MGSGQEHYILAGLKPWRERFMNLHRQRRVLLLATLLVLIIGYPYLGEDTADESLFVKVTTSVILLVGAYAISLRPWHFIAALVLASPGLVGRGLSLGFENRPLNLEIHLSSSAFYIFSIVLVLHQVLKSESVSFDTLAGAVSGYLLTGLMFASLYAVLELLDPQTFTFIDATESSGRIFWSNLIFFSFVTLTTLGYGDITPVSVRAQSLAIMEAVIGVFYMGVLVAWLVSAFRAERFYRERSSKG